MREVFVCREKCQVVPNGELSKQRIDGTDLDTCTATFISQSRRINVIFPIRLQQRQSGEAFDDLSLRLGTREPLQKLLQNQPCGDYDFCPEQGILEFLHLRFAGVGVTAKSQGPNACVNQQRHLLRDRSAL